MDINSRQNSAWNIEHNKINNDFIEVYCFFGCINLKDLFGFCEDYKRIIINCNQQLTVNRTSLDINTISLFKTDNTPEYYNIT